MRWGGSSAGCDGHSPDGLICLKKRFLGLSTPAMRPCSAQRFVSEICLLPAWGQREMQCRKHLIILFQLSHWCHKMEENVL